ncbi:MAG TPA: glycosyltransferase family 2 protein [Planctomycetota bacterium]|nr:glycosyltransferase family 2 protein [Planctomycetota bacterium]HRR78814.1 glycosyltransferase family 2 protein [Planctomycetota bacterium]HRT92879.1 glycosyltransferase family 2 protein [Planctomycetota bacterium]
MYRGRQIGVVVPAYNEETLIGRVLETMPAFVDRIYVVDDASHDQTASRVAEYAAREPGRIVLLRHESNQGVGAAIVTGYRRAVEDGIEIAAVMAGDAQMAPADLPAMLDPLVDGAADYVKGNRLFTGEAWKKIPRTRYLGNAFLSLLTKVASGYWNVADSQTGYTAVSRQVLTALPLDKLYRRYGYPNHLLVMLNVYNFRVADVPVTPVYNIGEKSGIRLRSVIPRMSWLLLKCFLWRMKEKYIIRDFHPLIFFYAVGALLLAACLALGARLLVHWSTYGVIPKTNALAAMTLFISGIQFLLFAMWFDMDHNKPLNRPTAAPGTRRDGSAAPPPRGS